MKFLNRLKLGESTLCTYTTNGREIKEGDILGYGDNYPCVVLYNKFEAKFDAVEFGYEFNGEPNYRTHDIKSYTTKWGILGNIDYNPELIPESTKENLPEKFDYSKTISEYYD